MQRLQERSPGGIEPNPIKQSAPYDKDSPVNATRYWHNFSHVHHSPGPYAEAIVNSLEDAILIITAQLHIRFANLAFYKTFELTEPIIGETLQEMEKGERALPPLSASLLQLQNGELKTTEWEIQFALPAPDRFIDLHIKAQPLQAPGTEDLLILVFKDVTLQRKEAARLQASTRVLENELKMIEPFFRRAPALFCILKGPDHVFEFVNSWHPKIINASNLPGKPFADAFPELASQGYKEILDNVLESNAPYFGEHMRLTYFPGSTKKELYVDFACQAYTNDAGDIEGVMFFAYEVTKQVAARKLLQDDAFKLEAIINERTISLVESNAALETSNRNLQAFASIASHDLQEPLRKIKTFLGLFRKRHSEDLAPEAHQLLQKTEAAAVRMSNLIRDVLSYSRIATPDSNFNSCRLEDIVRNVLEDFELLIGEKKGTVHLHHPLPEIECIPSQMNQLFYNLIGNALKFSAPQRSPHIDITCEQLHAPDAADEWFAKDTTYYNITIKDNGIGFEQAYATQIFSIFERLNNASQFDGTGIGLALCKRIVHFHKGRISARGEPGIGSLFSLVLPATQTGTNVVQQFQMV